MSSNESVTQFFPVYLKWASILFFGIVVIGIIAVALFSPQLINDSVKSAIDDSKLFNEKQDQVETNVPSATSSADLLVSKPSPTFTSEQSITATEEIGNEAPLESKTTAHNSAPNGVNLEHCQYSGNQIPKIIGIKFRQFKYFYTPGSQPYYALQNLGRIDTWHCRESTALEQGWVKGPDNILNLINQDNETSQGKNNANQNGLINGVLNLLGM